jgi:hypothetical protein
MPQDSLSSLTAGIGNAQQLVMVCVDVTGAGNDALVRFNPTYARIVQPILSPFQHVNMSLDGGFHVFQYSTNEALTWNIEFQNLPSFDGSTDARELSMGMLDLRSFIRYSLNYHASTCVIYSPDGFIEPSMKYLGGIETLAEADAGQRNTAQRAQRWAGIISFGRTLPWTYSG